MIRYGKRFLFLVMASMSSLLLTAQQTVTLFPANRAEQVNPDTWLQITFERAPLLTNKGTIRVYDAATNELVDELDLSIPPGPKNTRTPAPYDSFVYAHIPDTVYTVAKPDLDSSHVYQKNYIGSKMEIDAYHFYPLLLRDKSAKIFLHQGRLAYNKTYYVLIDEAVFGGGFKLSDKKAWTFTTKKTQPASRDKLVVAADGSGDFTTVQGAIDFIPEGNATPVTISIKNGLYEEIVNFRNRQQVRFAGEDREKTVIAYPNNGVFNLRTMSADPGLAGKYHNIRAVMAVYQCADISISNLTLRSVGEKPAQAEALLVLGDKIIVRNVSMEGSGDALQATGRIYVVDSKIQGFGDNVLGYGAVFFNRCDFVSTYGPHLWVRNTDKNHGNVLVNCTLRTVGGVETHIARAPDNKGTKYPYAEAVLINCKVAGLKPEGWGKVTDSTEHIRYWEFNTTRLEDGKPVDMSKRHPASRQLTLEKDAELIRKYSSPAFVLNGWLPRMEP